VKNDVPGASGCWQRHDQHTQHSVAEQGEGGGGEGGQDRVCRTDVHHEWHHELGVGGGWVECRVKSSLPGISSCQAVCCHGSAHCLSVATRGVSALVPYACVCVI
jgi:hypothetical protein